MSDNPLWAIAGAVLGASASGAFSIWDRISERKQRKKALLTAARSHAQFISKLVRDQRYEADARKVLDASKLTDWDGGLLIVDIPSHYLDGIRKCAGSAGELDAGNAADVIAFCHRAQIFIDSTRVEMKFHEYASLAEKRSHAEETVNNIEGLLSVGDRLSQAK